MEESGIVENSTLEANVPEQSPVQEQVPVKVDKMVTMPQSKINEMIRHSNGRVAERARQEERAKWENQSSSINATSSNPSNSLTEEEIRRIATEAADNRQREIIQAFNQQQQEQEAKKIAQEFLGKIENADHSLYPTLSSSLKNRDEFNSLMSNMLGVVALSNTMDGTEAIINELLENPLKIGSINDLAMKQPALAKRELQKMVDSIKLNQKASQAKMPNEPLSRIQPSTQLGMDNGSTSGYSVSDFRKMFKSPR